MRIKLLIVTLFCLFSINANAASTLRHMNLCDYDNATHCADVSNNAVAQYLVDSDGNPIGSHPEPGSSGKYSLNVHDAHVHTVLVSERFRQDSGTSELLTAAASPGEYSLTVANGATFTVGDEVIMYEGSTEEKTVMTITIVAGNVITLDRQIENTYTTAARLEITETNLASSVGTLASPQEYIVRPPSGEIWHINRIIVTMTDDAVMDDESFGGIASLTNGVTLRYEDGGAENLANWKANGDFALDTYDTQYPDKVPSGTYSVRARFTFINSGTVVRLDGSLGDRLILQIADNLTAITTYHTKAQGHKEGS